MSTQVPYEEHIAFQAVPAGALGTFPSLGHKIVLDLDVTSGLSLCEEGSLEKRYHAQEFAELAGVTVRTLHYYDRLALLQPKRTTAGYRLYQTDDLKRLEQIIALKFLGIPLKQIKVLLDREPSSLPDALQAQRRALEEKRRRLDQAIGAIRDAETSLQNGQQDETALLKRIIEVIEMQNEDWSRYYSEGAQAKIAERQKEWMKHQPQAQEEASRAWSELYRDVEAALDEDPASERVQALAARWRKLIEAFTGGDPEIEAGLQKAWQDRQNWSGQMKQRTEAFSNPRIGEFMQKAMSLQKPQP